MPNSTPKALTPFQQEDRRRRVNRALLSDLGFKPNTFQLALVRAASTLIVENELADIARARGEPSDAHYCQRVGKLLVIYARLGLRVPKPPEPVAPAEPEEETLADYLKHKEAELAVQRALGFTDEEDQEPCMEFSLDDEAAEPSASELPSPPEQQVAPEPVAVTKPVALDVRELGRISGEAKQSFAQVLDERAKK